MTKKYHAHSHDDPVERQTDTTPQYEFNTRTNHIEQGVQFEVTPSLGRGHATTKTTRFAKKTRKIHTRTHTHIHTHYTHTHTTPLDDEEEEDDPPPAGGGGPGSRRHRRHLLRQQKIRAPKRIIFHFLLRCAIKGPPFLKRLWSFCSVAALTPSQESFDMHV